jgi:hypothetical protein
MRPLHNRPVDITFVLHMKILEQNRLNISYIFDSGKLGFHKDRISLLVSTGNLVFKAVDRASIPYFLEIPLDEVAGRFHTFYFEIDNSANRSKLSIYSDNILIKSNVSGFPIIFSNNPFLENYFIGANIRPRVF